MPGALAEPGKVLGVPLWPYQALLAGELLLLMFGALFLLSAVLPPHPLTAFGPPGPATPEVKPDWYLMWIYGFLKIVPPWASFSLFGATIGPNFLGGMLFPAAAVRGAHADSLDRPHQSPRRAPVRVSGARAAESAPAGQRRGALVFIGTLFIAAYYDTLGLSLAQIWAIVLVVPLLAGLVTWIVATRTAPAERFDPRESPVPVAPRAGRCHARAHPRAGAATNLAASAEAPVAPLAWRSCSTSSHPDAHADRAIDVEGRLVAAALPR